MTVGRITARDKWEVADREARLRRNVYPRWVKNGKLTPGQAEFQIEVMSAIADDYRKRMREEEGQGALPL